MGFFDRFKGKKAQVEAAAPSASPRPTTSPWAARFREFRSMDERDKLALCGDLLTEMAPQIENGLVKPLPDDDEIELRGRVEGMPARVNLEFDVGWVRLEMKINNRVGELSLHRDHEKIPKQKLANDDWADEDELRVFIARGIFVEGQERQVASELTTVQSLPSPFVPWLTTEMERLKMSRLFAYADTMNVGFDPNVYEMADPAQQIFSGLHVMKVTAQTLAAGQRDLAIQASPGVQLVPVPRVQCAYCSTLFLLGDSSKCPNCAAAYGS